MESYRASPPKPSEAGGSSDHKQLFEEAASRSAGEPEIDEEGCIEADETGPIQFDRLGRRSIRSTRGMPRIPCGEQVVPGS